jgi:putative transposase
MTKQDMAMCGIQMKASPSLYQKMKISQWIGCSRFIYNAKCEEQDYFFKFKCRFASLVGETVPVDQAYSQFKTKDSEFLSQCPSEILRNTAVIWYQAMQRFFKGVSGLPVKKRKGVRDSIWLTKELFELTQDEATGEWKLFIGKKKNNIGFLSFKAHREFLQPASITLSKKNGDYFVSFNYEDPKLNSKTQEELIEELAKLPQEQLLRMALGVDRGIINPAYTSTGQSYDFSEAQKKAIEKKQKNIKKWQRRLARQKIGSRRRGRVKKKIAKAHQKIADIRKDFAHQTSRALVGKKDKEGQVIENGIQILVMEDLKVKNMTKSPEPKPDEKNPGSFLPNHSAAKAGLNRKILESAWGLLDRFLSYKAAYAGKVFIKVSPQYSSQECAECGHTHPDNRQTQSQFICLKCGYTANADYNGAVVIKKRGVEEVLKQATRGIRESARGGTRKTPRASKLKVQTLRSENRRRQGDDAALIPGSTGL